MEILETTNYDKFKSVKGNRELYLGHLNTLTNSMLSRNMLAVNPIIVNEKFEILDGQHRFEVAKANAMPIYYVILENAGIDEVMLLNKSNKKWNTTEFLQSFATRGYKEYQWITEYMENYQLSYTQAVWFLFGSRGSWAHRNIQSGRLELNEEQKAAAQRRAEILWAIRPFFKGAKGRTSQAIITAIVDMEREGLGKKIIQGVKKKGKPFKPAAVYNEAVEQLRELAE